MRNSKGKPVESEKVKIKILFTFEYFPFNKYFIINQNKLKMTLIFL